MENDNREQGSTSYPGHMQCGWMNLNFAKNICRKMWAKYGLFAKQTMRLV